MNKYRVTISFIALLITIGFIFIANGYISRTDSNAQKYKFDSREAAIIDGMEQNSKTTVQPEEPLENVALSTEHNGSLYMIIKVPFEEYGMDKDYVYAAAAKEENGKFCFEKLSPDISLNTLGDVKDVDYTPSATFYFDDIEGLYFAVGKIYNEQYIPYFHGEQLKLLNGDIYAVVQEKERPQVDVIKAGD